MNDPGVGDERIEREVRQFFAGYAGAFDALDPDAVARRFCVPAIMSTNTGYAVWSTPEEVVANMRALCEHYRRHGLREVAWELRDVVAQPPVHAFVNVRWTVHRHGELPAWTFRTSYTLRHDGAAWRILLCTAYEEQDSRIHAD